MRLGQSADERRRTQKRYEGSRKYKLENDLNPYNAITAVDTKRISDVIVYIGVPVLGHLPKLRPLRLILIQLYC